MTSLTLTELESNLDSNQFQRVHRGYIINLKKIDYLDVANNRVMVAGQEIPISRAKKAGLLKQIQLLQ